MELTVKKIRRGIAYGLLPDDDKGPPKCCHKVSLAIQVQRARCKERHKGKEGTPNGDRHLNMHPNRCHRLGLYLVDGLPMCASHAGAYVLNALTYKKRK